MSKIKILFLAANPAATKQLQLDEEIREITAKIRASEYRDSLELISIWAVRPDDLLQTLLEHKPDIVHFSGHGSPTAEIILQDQNGRSQPVSKEALVHLFRTLASPAHGFLHSPHGIQNPLVDVLDDVEDAQLMVRLGPQLGDRGGVQV